MPVRVAPTAGGLCDVLLGKEVGVALRTKDLRRVALLSATAALMLLQACSKDESSPGDSNIQPPQGLYLLSGEFGGRSAPGGFGLFITPLDTASAPASDFHVTVDSMPLVRSEQADTSAVEFFSITPFLCQPDSVYEITAALGDGSATCSFIAPDFPRAIFSSPADSFRYTPGLPITLIWTYAGGTPDDVEKVYVEARSSRGEQAPVIATLFGAATVYQISGTESAAWEGAESLCVRIELATRATPFSDELASGESGVSAIGAGDTLCLKPTPPEPQWNVTLALDHASLPADGLSRTTAHVTVADQFGTPPPDTTVVTFRGEPAGLVSFDPASVQTTAGAASVWVNADTTAGEVRVSAFALGDSAQATLTLRLTHRISVGAGATPEIRWDPPDAMIRLRVRDAGLPFSIWDIAGQLTPPVTHGTVPSGALQIYPLLGLPAASLETGVTYRILLTDSHGEVIMKEFTR